MPRQISLPLIACFAATSLSAQAQDRFDILSSCAASVSHVEQRECLEHKLEVSHTALKSAEKSLAGKINNAMEEPQDKRRAIAAAKSDVREFGNYVYKHCEAFATLAYGGNSQGDRRLACRIELNTVRALQLKKVAAATS